MNSARVIILNEVIFTVFLQQQHGHNPTAVITTFSHNGLQANIHHLQEHIQGNIDHLHLPPSYMLEPSNNNL